MKRGSFYSSAEAIQALGKLLIIIISVVIIVYSLILYMGRDLDTDDIKSNILVSRLFYSNVCSSYNDDVRSYPGIVDLQKFNEINLGKCFDLIDSNIQMKYSLRDLENKVVKEVNLNKILSFDLCKIKNKNINCYFNKQYVLYFENGIRKEGIVSSTILIRHE